MKKVTTAAKPDKRKPKKKCVKIVLELSLEKVKEPATMQEEAIQTEELINNSKMNANVVL